MITATRTDFFTQQDISLRHIRQDVIHTTEGFGIVNGMQMTP